MRSQAIHLSLIAVAAGITALGQSGNPNTIAATGYLFPGPLSVAPGQVITLFVAGVGAGLKQSSVAGPGDLPTTLAGISATLVQSPEVAVPILRVTPLGLCDCGATSAITVQIPFELKLPPPTGGLTAGIELFVTENGVAGASRILSPMPDQAHILTDCDTVLVDSGPSSGRCPWEVTHADGSLVTAANPASQGEELVMYAVGLGATNPVVPTGKAVTQPTPTANSFQVGFNFQANALPLAPPQTTAAPVYTGLTPGRPGLYQINFVVPPVPAGLPACYTGQGADFVNTNLAVSIGRFTFADGALICVSVPK
jgi:uncharacterized protein (TIGR03437 family)